MVVDALFILFSYLLGSLSAAIIFSHVLGLQDPRTMGSGNPGATNMLRTSGKKVAIAVLIGDVVKGIVPVLIAKAAGFSDFVIAGSAFAAFIGHLFPIFFRFQGGKGVATALGGMLAWSLPLGGSLLGTWIVAAVLFRYSSLAALITAILSPAYCYYFIESNLYFAVGLMMAILLVIRHKENIQNLCSGRESKIGQSKS